MDTTQLLQGVQDQDGAVPVKCEDTSHPKKKTRPHLCWLISEAGEGQTPRHPRGLRSRASVKTPAHHITLVGEAPGPAWLGKQGSVRKSRKEGMTR